MHQLLNNIEHWWDFGDNNPGMDPYRVLMEGARGIGPSTQPRVGEIPIALQLEKEIASASETNFMQESQIITNVGPHLSDSSPSIIPRRDSNMQLTTIGANSDLLKEEPNRGNIQAFY